MLEEFVLGLELSKTHLTIHFKNTFKLEGVVDVIRGCSSYSGAGLGAVS